MLITIICLPQGAEALSPLQLVDGAVKMLRTSPTTAFALSDLLSAICRQKEGGNAAAVLQRLLDLLRGFAEGGRPFLSARLDREIQAPAHLLAVLIAENPSLAVAAYEQGAQRCRSTAQISMAPMSKG